ncbi:MAG: DUF86 domain-containing protein [Zoogloeaceae bacterium]|nr:DUF86 domain-containing protein [Zoogloeaceae bacterium]MCK6383526.1 DUF86 domain-containing protein [Rhodocyclaceae bacterium]
MSRDWLLYLDDLIDSAEKIGRFVAGRTLESLVSDEAAFDAVLFNLHVIGEAVKKFPAEACAALPEADVAGPARLRDLIAHHYFALDAEIIWEVATAHVPRLLAQARRLREQADK